MNRNILFALLLLILPAASHATPPPAFSGPPASFAGFDLAVGKVYFRLKLAKAGRFTGVLDVTGASHNIIRGTLDVSGSFSGIANPSKTPYTLALTGSTVATYFITGSAAGVNFDGFPMAYMRGQTVTELGRYTSVIETSGTTDIPHGLGYSTINVGKTGNAIISGKLPEGTSFTTSSLIVADGTATHLLIVDDRNLNNTKGFLVGYMAFQTTPSKTVSGDLIWQKPATKSHYYPAGFKTSVLDEGFFYDKSVAPFTSGSGTVALFHGNLASTGTQSFTISSGGVIKMDTPNPSGVKLSINRNNGSFSGAFNYSQLAGSTGNALVKYKGLLLQTGSTTTFGYGYFLSPLVDGTGASGAVEIVP